MKLVEKIFGTHSERELKMISDTVDQVESYRDAMMALSDSELRGKTKEFKKRYSEGETLDDLAKRFLARSLLTMSAVAEAKAEAPRIKCLTI